MAMEQKINNETTEKFLLECLLLNPPLIEMLSGFPKECFFFAKNRYIYQVMCKQYAEKRYFDLVTLAEDENIDPKYIATLTNNVPSPEVWKFYVKELRSMYDARRVKEDLANALNSIGDKTSSEVTSELITKLAAYSASEVNSYNMKDLAVTALEQIQKAFNNKRLYTGFESGFEGLDDIVDGFQKDNMYVIGARPSIGKTAFALALVMGIASKGIKTSVFSLEMSATSLFYRMASARSDIPMWQIKKGVINETSMMSKRFMAASQYLFELPINVMDSGIDNDKVLYSRIRYEAKVNHAEVIVIDHLGLIEVSDSSGQRYVDVGRITKTLHKMARELNVCIIVLAQCGREAEGKKPNLALLRESGNIEQDADVIMLLHRQRELDDEKEKDNPLKVFPTDVIVAKNRDGKTGTATFSFKPICMKFTEDANRSVLSDDEGGPKYKVKPKTKEEEDKDNEIPY